MISSNTAHFSLVLESGWYEQQMARPTQERRFPVIARAPTCVVLSLFTFSCRCCSMVFNADNNSTHFFIRWLVTRRSTRGTVSISNVFTQYKLPAHFSEYVINTPSCMSLSFNSRVHCCSNRVKWRQSKAASRGLVCGRFVNAQNVYGLFFVSRLLFLCFFLSRIWLF